MSKFNIPPAALEAGARALARGIEIEDYWPYYKDDARAAFVAMVTAWEGMHHYEPNVEPYYGKHLILPLPPPPAGETNEV